MQFVANGPDIPEGLLQSHEEGQVIFFCGAGISYPAGLPGFGGLVDGIYAVLGVTRTAIEDEAYKNQKYDSTLDLLERRVPGHRAAVRGALANVLKPNLRLKGATATHAALLQLGRDSAGNVRLVTTNFDTIFQRLMKRAKPAIPGYPAPLLPIPKNSRWNGVVYLHGLLPDGPDEAALNRLVLSSGDFGLAYLTERWAARFVGELFRNYVVCFVGYSINDPVLRYMMDALAADRLLGETTPQAYAFGSFYPGDEAQAAIEWEAKGVTPVLYEVSPVKNDHSVLHQTLTNWAATHRDGVLGKEAIVARYAVNPPMGSTRNDNFVGRILWAVCDTTSLPAKRFADLDPVPPIEWLEPLSADRFLHGDLSRFGVPPKVSKDDKLSFSVTHRPAPYTNAPWMTLINRGHADSKWDGVMFQLARWLLRHLDDPKLLLWVVKRGGQLSQQWSWLIARQFAELDRLAAEGNAAELARRLESAPRAIPSAPMRTLWGILLSGRVSSHAFQGDLYDWLSRFKREGLSAALRIELREILSPRVKLSEPFGLDEEEPEADEADEKIEVLRRISDLVRWEIVVGASHPHSALSDRPPGNTWDSALPGLLDDLSLLLRDALDLKRDLGGADDRNDGSNTDQPSISEHRQNRRFHDWTVLIDLARDAWVATAKVDAERARHVAESWWHVRYPVFKRLALFTSVQGTEISSDLALDWVLGEGSWWLWSDEIRRELMRYLVLAAPKLARQNLRRLEAAILKGPPREMYRGNIEADTWSRLVDHSVWLRFTKLDTGGAELSVGARRRLNAIAKTYPDWKLAADERDEFPFWMDSGWVGEDGALRQSIATPRLRKDLVRWLAEHPVGDHWNGDDWRSRCSDDFSATATALCSAARMGQWPTERWREALQAWSEDKLLRRSWRYMAPVVATAPTELFEACRHGIGWWLRSVANSFIGHDRLFFDIAQRLMAVETEDQASEGRPVDRAINHFIGHATEALLRWWYRQSPLDGQSLPSQIKPMFTAMCDAQVDKYRHGRVLLAAHAIALYRVDVEWATAQLLPLFDWDRSEVEARAAWEGFLWAPRLFLPLIAALKRPLLATATHYSQLGDHARQYAEFLAFAALEPGDVMSVKELALATDTLPSDGLQHAAQAIARALGGSGEQRPEYWRNRVQPYLRFVWPKSSDRISPPLAESLARVCIAAGDAFPDAFLELRSWLVPVEYPDYLIHLLHDAKLDQQYPDAALDFMDKVIGESSGWPPGELKQCLDAIEAASPRLIRDARHVRLSTYSRVAG